MSSIKLLHIRNSNLIMTQAHPTSLGSYIEAKNVNIVHEIVFKYNKDPIQVARNTSLIIK